MQTKCSVDAIKLLKEWMSENNVSKAGLCRLLKHRWPKVWAWFKKTRRPNLDAAIGIEQLTNGYVFCAAWAKKPLSSKPTSKKKNQKKKTSA